MIVLVFTALFSLVALVSSGWMGTVAVLGSILVLTGLWQALFGKSWLTPILPKGRRIGLGAILAGTIVTGIAGALAMPVEDSPAIAAPASPSPSAVPAPTASPEPSATLSPSPTPHIAEGTALAALAGLEIKGRAPKTGYDRDLFGQAWADVDRNGCDTRNDVLRRDLSEARTTAGSNGCVVDTGILHDPYTATTIEFVRGSESSQAVQIDHVVALSDAWQKGAQQLDVEVLTQFANDPLNLLAVDGSANQQKSDGDAATWLPSNKAFRCEYVARQVAVKANYGLWVTQAEHDAIESILLACPEAELLTTDPVPNTAESIDVAPAAPSVAPTPTPLHVQTTPAPVATTPAPTTAPPSPPAPAPVAPAPVPAAEVYYENCTAARAAGAAPLLVGEPGYRTRMDGDKDGIACE